MNEEPIARITTGRSADKNRYFYQTCPILLFYAKRSVIFARIVKQDRIPSVANLMARGSLVP
jgi:hypothetical protein